MKELIRMRLGLIFFFMLFLFLLVVLRLLQFQVVEAKELSDRALSQRLRIDTITPERGDILDRNGKILAESIPTPAVYADPSIIKNPQKTAEALAPVLDMNVEELY
ncbi:MAG: stage V sporulation protein D, partial [Firmicutes bacterium]|nr:stage V sporulation protein D [Bacillota bacterium]